jgi:hypothetical protein
MKEGISGANRMNRNSQLNGSGMAELGYNTSLHFSKSRPFFLILSPDWWLKERIAVKVALSGYFRFLYGS